MSASPGYGDVVAHSRLLRAGGANALLAALTHVRTCRDPVVDSVGAHWVSYRFRCRMETMRTVWVEAWQMQCCGEAIEIGSQVRWRLEEPDEIVTTILLSLIHI